MHKVISVDLQIYVMLWGGGGRHRSCAQRQLMLNQLSSFYLIMSIEAPVFIKPVSTLVYMYSATEFG